MTSNININLCTQVSNVYIEFGLERHYFHPCSLLVLVLPQFLLIPTIFDSLIPVSFTSNNAPKQRQFISSKEIKLMRIKLFTHRIQSKEKSDSNLAVELQNGHESNDKESIIQIRLLGFKNLSVDNLSNCFPSSLVVSQLCTTDLESHSVQFEYFFSASYGFKEETF